MVVLGISQNGLVKQSVCGRGKRMNGHYSHAAALPGPEN